MPTPEEKRAAERVELVNRLSVADNALDVAEKKLAECRGQLRNAETIYEQRQHERMELAEKLTKHVDRPRRP